MVDVMPLRLPPISGIIECEKEENEMRILNEKEEAASATLANDPLIQFGLVGFVYY